MKTTVMQKEVIRFLENQNELSQRNRWFYGDGLEVYLRRGMHVLQSKGKEVPVMYPTVDVANVNAKSEGQGSFTRFMDFLESHVKTLHDYHCIYIENIHNAHLPAWFSRRGYILSQVAGIHHRGKDCDMYLMTGKGEVIQQDNKQGKAMDAKLKKQIVEWLKESLEVVVEDGDFTCPNDRTIKLKLEGKVISSSTFDIRQKSEYEG